MYATIADLEARIAAETLAELADENRDGSPDAEIMEAALADASAEMDLFLAARYATPIDPPHLSLAGFAADIAIHRLFARKRAAVSPPHAARYAAAIRRMSEIATGRLRLSGAALKPQCDATRRGAPKAFSTESLKTF